MSTDTFYIAQGDRVSSLTRTLTSADQSAPIDLSSAIGCEFQLASLEGTIVVSGDCLIVDRPGGVVRYDWADGDTAVAGQYLARFIITWPGNLRQTVPNNSAMLVKITAGFTAP